jgi:hypothetical protein
MVAGEVLTGRGRCLKSCYNLQGKYGRIDTVGANVASGGDGGGRRYSYNRCNMIRLRIIKPDERSCYKKKGITLYSTTKPGVHIISYKYIRRV